MHCCSRKRKGRSVRPASHHMFGAGGKAGKTRLVVTCVLSAYLAAAANCSWLNRLYSLKYLLTFSLFSSQSVGTIMIFRGSPKSHFAAFCLLPFPTSGPLRSHRSMSAPNLKSHLKFAEVKVLVKDLRLGLRKHVSVNLLRDALLVADCTGVEGRNGFVIVQISTSDLHQAPNIVTTRVCSTGAMFFGS